MNSYEIIAWLGKHVGRGADLCMDSRQIKPGDVFFAMQGAQSSGTEFIADAIQKGAAAIISESESVVKQDYTVPHVQVRDLRGILGYVAHHWYREPSHAVTVVAVTGTNGKTTCVNWIAAALNAQGLPCGTIGTLGVACPDGRNLGGDLTTPDVLTMHRSLAELRDAGAAVVALEASSIGIDQGRLDQVKIEIAAFTNLTHDHLDYHKSLEEYKQAKFKLFKRHNLGAAVVNLDDEVGRELLDTLSLPSPITYSLQQETNADIQANDVQASGYGLVFNLKTPRGSSQLLTRLVGVHNISNLLLVAAVLRQLGWGMSRTVRTLGALTPVDGRLEVVEAPECGSGGSAPMVVVDYSHTPDSLERALIALRDTANARAGSLICVFGCGGSRDPSKRPVMGKIAEKHADRVIVTNDNPRDEDAKSIAQQIIAGMEQKPEVELDRARAILSSIWQASDKDVILIAGKGHETTQEFADRTIVFDDREWARLALMFLKNVSLSTDTRSIESGQVFWAIKGDHFDGHDYLDAACMAGACAAVVNIKNPAVPLYQVQVNNTRNALAICAELWRKRFNIPVIGITGSNGKTTTKEMIASILRCWQNDHVLATIGNLNNDLGVPLTLLRLKSEHLVAAVEMGMNQPGEISALSKIAQPTVGLITNAQREHQEFMRTVDAVAQENGSVLEALPESGFAVIPGDDPYTELWLGLSASSNTVTFGFDSNCSVYADSIKVQKDRTEFVLNTPVGSESVVLRVRGHHNLRNALAAASCAVAVDVPLPIIVRGLQSFNPVDGRLYFHDLPDGRQLIDDTYNANPDSVRAAIDVLAELPSPKVLVLGNMAEVGEDYQAVHAEVGEYAQQCGIDVLITLGDHSAFSAQAFGENAYPFESINDLSELLFKQLPANVLVKGSRSSRMERVVAALKEHTDNLAEGDDNAS